MNTLDEIIRSSPVAVHPERYAVARVRAVNAPQSHFAVCTDECETTVVTQETRLAECDVEQVETPFAMLEFCVGVPFYCPGFLARICTRLAERSINVLIYSTFSRDYVLVPWASLDESVRVLQEAGFTVHYLPSELV